MADGTARINVTAVWTWDGDGTSTAEADIAAYNAAMSAIADAVRCAGDDLPVRLVGVEASG